MVSLPIAKETTVQPSNSFVLSKAHVKQTKAQVFESSNNSSRFESNNSSRFESNNSSTNNNNNNSNYSVIKPQLKDQVMLEEYMTKLNQMNRKSNEKSNGSIRKSESSDNVITNEFMRVREEKFGKRISNEDNEIVARENQKNLARTNNIQQQQQNGKFVSKASNIIKITTFNEKYIEI